MRIRTIFFSPRPLRNEAPLLQSQRISTPDRHQPLQTGQSSIALNQPGTTSHPPATDRGAYWSGIPFPLTQSAAAEAGLQTMVQSVTETITNHPDQERGTSTRAQFWDWFCEGYSNAIVEGDSSMVTVLLREPNVLLSGPSDPLTDGRMISRSSRLTHPDPSSDELSLM